MNNKDSKILVTGANGYIGSHTVSYLIENGYRVIAVDFDNTNISNSAEFISIDILKYSNSSCLFQKLNFPDRIIHLAWQDGFNHNAKSHIENIHRHFDFLVNMIDSGIKSLSIMGTMHELGYVEGIIKDSTPSNPLNYYGVAKNTLRQALTIYAQDKDVSLKWLRAFYIYGDDEKNHSIFTKLIQTEHENKKYFPFTAGVNFYDFIHIDEISKQIARASLQDETDGIINVCSGEPVALKDKVEEYIKEHHFKIKLKPGVFPKRKYDSPIVYGDNSKIKEILKENIND